MKCLSSTKLTYKGMIISNDVHNHNQYCAGIFQGKDKGLFCPLTMILPHLIELVLIQQLYWAVSLSLAPLPPFLKISICPSLIYFLEKSLLCVLLEFYGIPHDSSNHHVWCLWSPECTSILLYGMHLCPRFPLCQL